jgi:hypothetical protein
MIFFSPLFLRFVHRVLRPLMADGSPARLVALWRKHRGLCPSVAAGFLSDLGDKAPIVLSRGFFEVILSRPSDFALCEFNETPSEELLDALNARLTIEGAECELSELIAELEPDGGMIQLLDVIDQQDCPELFQRVLMSRFDDQTLVAMLNKAPAALVGAYRHRLFYRLPKGVEEEQTGHLAMHPTMCGSTAGVHMRHILQLCDAIPEEPPPCSSFPELMYEVLVNRGPRATMHRRLEMYRHMAFDDSRVTPDNVARWTRGVVLERTREIRAISTFQRIDTRSFELEAATYETRMLIERAFIASQVRALFDMWAVAAHRRSLRGYRPTIVYYRDPRRVRDELALSVARLAKELPMSEAIAPCDVGQILFGLITREFQFTEYARFRTDLMRLEDEVQTALASRSAAQWVDVLFPVASCDEPGRWRADAFLHEQMLQIAQDERFLGRMRKAFVEQTSFRKLARGSRAVAALRQRLKIAAVGRDLGADDFQPAEVGYTLLSRPNFVLANYAFLADFYRTQERKFDQFFHEESVTFLAGVSEVVHRAIGRYPDALLPQAEVALWTAR